MRNCSDGIGAALRPLILTLALVCGALWLHAQPAPPQHRSDVSGLRGAVVSDHPLATAAGYEVLRRGGHAVDAAITMAGVLAVVRPHMNGVGGDAFGLFYDGSTGGVTALNGSGRAGALATPEFFTSRDITSMPQDGAASVTVPGAVAAWDAALQRHGTITLADALAPAIRLAEEGWVVTSTLERDVASSVGRLNEGGRRIFAPTVNCRRSGRCCATARSRRPCAPSPTVAPTRFIAATSARRLRASSRPRAAICVPVISARIPSSGWSHWPSGSTTAGACMPCRRIRRGSRNFSSWR
jgi:hypothetical protein